MFGEGTLGFYASQNMVKKVSVLYTHTYSLYMARAQLRHRYKGSALLMWSRSCPVGNLVHLVMVNMRLVPPGLFFHSVGSG